MTPFVQPLAVLPALLKRCLVAALALALAACAGGGAQTPDATATAPATAPATPTDWSHRPTLFADGAAVAKPGAGSGTLMFFRKTAAGAAPEPVNIYIDGRYLSSLLPGGNHDAQACAGARQVAAVTNDAGLMHQGRVAQSLTLQLAAGDTHIYEVTALRGHAAQVVRSDAAALKASQTRRQVHALQRTPRCTAQPVAAASR